MSTVLFLGLPSQGHINPTLGLVSELVRRGERVVYFASPAFKRELERAGAEVRFYAADLDASLINLLPDAEYIIDDILDQTDNETFEYLVHSDAFPFAGPIAQILQLPNIASMANGKVNAPGCGPHPDYEKLKKRFTKKYGVSLPEDPSALLGNTGVINLVYTSRYFAGPPVNNNDDTFKFVGPPVNDKDAGTDFPIKDDSNVLYIDVKNQKLNGVFAEAFRDWNGKVVLEVDDDVNEPFPDNFIVRSHVPHGKLLQHAAAAITQGNITDFIRHEVPFVSLPVGADQTALAQRAAELGATVVLDAKEINAAQLKRATTQVATDKNVKESLARINGSFEEAGGYPWAVAEIFAAVKERTLIA